MLLNGARTAALVRARGGGKNEMERTMAVSLRESVQLVSDPETWMGVWRGLSNHAGS